MIRVENLTKEYDGKVLFHDINMNIEKGEVVGIIGPSGSGKSVLLRSLVTLVKPTSGKIFLDDTEITDPDTDLSPALQKIGMVFQQFNLFSHLSVIENVMSGMVHVQKIDYKEAYEEAMRILKTVGLSDKAFASPKILSGGQQQRAAIARTIAMKPEIILMDEPTSALDPIVKGEVEAVIRMLASEGHTMVIVTHEMSLARDICSRVIFLKDGEIIEEGKPEKIFDDADNPETRRFVRGLRVMEFSVNSKDFDFIGNQTEILTFSFRNGVPTRLQERLLAILEELFQMIIIQPKEDNVMHIEFEWNRNEQSLIGEVKFSGPPVDPDDPHYFISWPIIQMRASEISNEEIQEGAYTNLMRIVIKDR